MAPFTNYKVNKGMKLHSFLIIHKSGRVYACYRKGMQERRKLVAKNYQRKPRVEFVLVKPKDS